MSFSNQIPKLGDYEQVVVFQVDGVAQDISAFNNYAAIIFYQNDEDIHDGGSKEIVRMSKDAATGFSEFLFAENEEAGEFKMKVRRSIMEPLTEGARLIMLFYTQSTDADHESSQFRSAADPVALGTIVFGVPSSDLEA